MYARWRAHDTPFCTTFPSSFESGVPAKINTSNLAFSDPTVPVTYFCPRLETQVLSEGRFPAL
jgi:hypothetical protein